MMHKRSTVGLVLRLSLFVPLLLVGSAGYAIGGITPPDNTYEAGYDDGFADGHDAGVIDGYNAGIVDGFDAGFADGFDAGIAEGGYEDGFEEGYSAGFSEGEAEGYTTGFNDGRAAGIGLCAADPTACGIDLFAFLGDSTYGETEPNNHIPSADRLQSGFNYHGNSYSVSDQDWYWIETTEPNQNLNFSFSGQIEDTPLDGWIISVRDEAGNVLAAFDSNVEAPVDTINLNVRNFVVTLSAVGRHYVTVEPVTVAPDVDGFFNAYNIVANITSTGLDDPNFQGNFEDTEIEPNNSRAEATQLESRVTMHGYIDKNFTVVGTTGAFEYDSDIYRYNSSGDEEFTIQVCVLIDCPLIAPGGGAELLKTFKLRVEHQNGSVIMNGPISPGDSLNLGFSLPGSYYITFGPMETGEVIEVEDAEGNPIAVLPVVSDNSGPYNFTIAGTSLPTSNKGLSVTSGATKLEKR